MEMFVIKLEMSAWDWEQYGTIQDPMYVKFRSDWSFYDNSTLSADHIIEVVVASWLNKQLGDLVLVHTSLLYTEHFKDANTLFCIL